MADQSREGTVSAAIKSLKRLNCSDFPVSRHVGRLKSIRFRLVWHSAFLPVNETDRRPAR